MSESKGSDPGLGGPSSEKAPTTAARYPRIGITWGSKANGESMRKLAKYVDCIRQAGGEPIALLPSAAAGDAVAFVSRYNIGLFQLYVGEGASPKDFDGILFTGGKDIDPRHYAQTQVSDTLVIDDFRDGFELPLLEQAIREGTPVFGICRGLQVINVGLGGSLIQDIPSECPKAVDHADGATHKIRINPGSRLARLAGVSEVLVNSWHHQAVRDQGGLAPGLVATAHSFDGLVEAVEALAGKFSGHVMAVQWHPERQDAGDSQVSTELAQALFRDFTAVCRARLSATSC